MKKLSGFISISSLVVFLASVLSLAGCLVDEDSASSIKTRSTDELRQIQDGDSFDYYVEGQITPTGGGTPTPFTGSLNVTYNTVNFPEPFTGSLTISAIRENSTLWLGGALYTLRRYLVQDPLTGTLSVLAIESSGTIYRAGDSLLSNPASIVILPSPVPSTGTTSNTVYHFMSGCESPSTICNQIVQRINNILITYQGDADVTTPEGRFQTLRMDYDSAFLGTLSPNTPALFDLRGACDINSASFFGSVYVFPEVGNIYMENTCSNLTAGAGGFRYTAFLTNTNVNIP